MDAEQRNLLKTFFQSLEDRPLDPWEPIYEPTLHTFGNISDPVEELARQIDWSDKASVNLVSGQRGAGKSTELCRLRKRLSEDGCTVFMVDMESYLNLTQPIDIIDFLIALMGALGEAYRSAYSKDPTAESYWERFVNFAGSEVKLDLAFKAGVQLKAGLKAE